MQPDALKGGFADLPVQSATAFRSVLQAMARPGTIHQLAGAAPPPPLSVAAGVVLLTLCDPETPLFVGASVDTPDLRSWISFHTGAPFSAAGDAVIAIGSWQDFTPLSAFPVGSAEYPDRSTTLITEVGSLGREGSNACRLTGPGIQDFSTLCLPDPALMQANAALFPLGLDFILTSESSVAALPRSTRIEVM